MPRAPALVVPPSEAEDARRALRERGNLRRDLRVRRSADEVWLPVVSAEGDSAGGRWDEADFETVDMPRHYKDVARVPDEVRSNLPTSFDRIGDIAIIKIPTDLAQHAQAIGQAILETHASVRAVFEDAGVEGPWRVRRLQRIAGQGSSRTMHRQFGLTLEVDPAFAYFSPRLAGEHDRIARLVGAGERVLDATCGVAPFSIAMARAQPSARIVACDVNPDAVALAQANVARASVEVTVDVRQSDGFAEAQAGQPWDRIVVNVPHENPERLGTLAAALAASGTLHALLLCPDAQAEATARKIATQNARRLTHLRLVHPYSPEAGVYVMDFGPITGQDAER